MSHTAKRPPQTGRSAIFERMLPPRVGALVIALSAHGEKLATQLGHRALATAVTIRDYGPGRRILRSAQLLRSATVKRSRNELALTIFSRLVLPVALHSDSKLCPTPH